MVAVAQEWEEARLRPAEFSIDEAFHVPGVGTVVSGTMFAGAARPGDAMMLVPDTFGEFLPVSIKSVHSKRMAVTVVVAGQTAAFALKLPHGDKVCVRVR